MSSTMPRRYLGAMTAKTAYTLAAGRVLLTSLNTAHEKIVGMGGELRRLQTGEVQIIGTGADNATIAFKIWHVIKSPLSTGGYPTHGELRLIATVAATLSSAVLAAADTLLGTGETASAVRFADTLVVTETDYANAMGAALGAPGVEASSPADNTPATLWISDLGDSDYLIEFDVGTATGADAVVRELGV
jgi:hypothetical protein